MMNQQTRNKKVAKVKCWEVFKCNEKECPAYKSKNLRCWLISGTHCRSKIQGKFIEKMEMCADCRIFKINMDRTSMGNTCKVFNEQLKKFRQIVDKSNRELEYMSIELALSLSEVFEALKKISSGDPTVRIPETSEVELISKLKHIVNLTAENIGDISEKKAYEKKLERAATEWRATFDSMPYGVMLLDSDLNIIRANNYIAKLYNLPIQKMKGKSCSELHYGSNIPIEFCTALKSKNIYNTESFEYYDSRLNKYFMMHGTPIFEEQGLIKAYILSLIDISEIKDKEKRLIESKDAFFNMLKELDVSFKEIKELYESLIHSFINAIDAKSPWTKGHSERVTHYAVSIAEELGLKEKDIEMLRIASILHDIGKIGTYDVVLEKPDKLTDEEFALIRMHPVRGEEILKPIKQLRDLLPIIRHHHERLDGKGYPDGLTDGEIPFLSKIISIADSFDSMSSDRPYRPAPPREYAISELKRCSGTQFDPQAVEAFLRFLEKSKQ